MKKNMKKLKQKNFANEDIVQVRNLILILLMVLLVCVGLYFLTEKLIKKDSVKEEKTEEVKINYNIASIGTMFNRPEGVYYVILYSEEKDGVDYDNVLSAYRSSDNYVRTYYIDLDKKINKFALGESLNKKPITSNEVSVVGPTLFKIKDGKVVKCLNDLDSITNELK